jgi:beta-mannosidase
VWGGGIYENKYFYELCDEKGILVWQDFMFACALIPDLPGMRENIRREAEENVKRIRNHPSVAVWCGDNENVYFWQNWKKNNPAQPTNPFWKNVADSAIIIDMYKDISWSILPAAVASYDHDKIYWSSSPVAENYSLKYDFGNQNSGDSHNYDVWWVNLPMEQNSKKISTFTSETGFQSYPDFDAFKSNTLPEDWDLNSGVMKQRQKSSVINKINGNDNILAYLKKYYKAPNTFKSFIYLSQVLQAEVARLALETHRQNMPYCMGILYWQMNDVWTGPSWSGIDNRGGWKAQQYITKKAFNPILVTPQKRNDSIIIYGISDLYQPKSAVLKVQLVDFNGVVIKQEQKNIQLNANSSTKLAAIHQKQWLQNSDTTNTVLNMQLLVDNEVVSTNNLYFCSPKNQQLQKPTFKIKKIDEIHIEITSSKLVRSVWLYTPKIINAFDDNYFDLFPGEKKIITMKEALSLKDITVSSLFDALK